MNKKEIIQFYISKIKTEQFAEFKENYSSKIEEIKIDTSLEFKLDSKAKQVGVFLTNTFLQKKKIIIKIENVCYFQIIDDSWELLKKDNSIVLPKNFATHIAMIAVGTTRGVLHSKTVNTKFNKFILPTIDVMQLVQEDIEFIQS